MVSTLEKIRILGENGKYDICASTASSRSESAPNLFGNSPKWIGSTISAGVCHSYAPDGRCVSLFKVLFTNKCIYDCKYCFNNVCKKRVSFTPEEYARTFMKLYSMNVLEGLFISSGICGDADETTKQMLETIKLLRFKYNFRGYIHFKCLPGTSYYLLKEAVQLADRISVNLEAPTKEILEEIAEQKNYNTDIITRQRWLKEIRNNHNIKANKIISEQQDNQPPKKFGIQPDFPKYELDSQKINKKKDEWADEWGIARRSTGYKKIRWDGATILNSGQTTQMVLGAGSETDYDILKRLDWGYREIDLRRGYFSAFSPIKGTPLERRQATPLEREHRLYQTDWLLRLYHFPIKDIKGILARDENLPKGDPKIHLARNYFGENGKIDPNKATYEELIRVPGIGLTSARRIIRLRQDNHLIKTRSQLHSIGVILKRADPFLRINGHIQTTIDAFKSMQVIQ
ncbi:putative DNA modification/repair radical SAM protein [Promethearchaeum syntrophicum]|uniref:DNA modification/repair radical SAM protein n=1 Tax=Promethearchaeum syntrophicum TaxID=2594042 RepID=A0A5B9DDI8_9ARCH|nr:putative DNA modification/repair radical SAM protein [Candidatus Prometheoarchaeum syntrophicum]QEE17308.1 Helix-hairpin-helix motif protein [Candidatus Prometheoarchaeum syntrophicum]